MKIGDVDVAKSIINLEYEMLMMQRILEYITKQNSNLIMPSSEELKNFRDKVIDSLQKKYPNMGIKPKH